MADGRTAAPGAHAYENVLIRGSRVYGSETPDYEWLFGLLERPEWQKRAACRGMDPDIFYPDDKAGAERARHICLRCPVAAECREAGRTERLGVWGGSSAKERRGEKTAADPRRSAGQSHGYAPEIHAEIWRLYLEGMGGRAIGRHLQVGRDTVFSSIRRHKEDAAAEMRERVERKAS